MPQMHFYVPEDVAEKLRTKAKQQGISVSKFLAELARQEIDGGWPTGYFDNIFGAWQGEFPEPEELTFEKRELF